MSIYENTPAYCERAAHIAKGDGDLQGSSSILSNYHSKRNLEFRKEKNMKKLISLILVLAMVMAFAATTYALDKSFEDKYVFGGPSQQLTTEIRSRTNNVQLSVTWVNLNGQSGWRFRGYEHGSAGSTCTALSSTISGTGVYTANYTSLPAVVTVNSSIASSVASNYLIFDGTLYI